MERRWLLAIFGSTSAAEWDVCSTHESFRSRSVLWDRRNGTCEMYALETDFINRVIVPITRSGGLCVSLSGAGHGVRIHWDVLCRLSVCVSCLSVCLAAWLCWVGAINNIMIPVNNHIYRHQRLASNPNLPARPAHLPRPTINDFSRPRLLTNPSKLFIGCVFYIQESSEHHREYAAYLRHLIQVSKPVLAADSLYPLPSIRSEVWEVWAPIHG